MILRADARQLPLRDKCVQCVVTSPPYWGLRDYGHGDQIGLEPTPDAYVQTLVAVFREVRRVLKDDGTVFLNLGDSYAGGGGYAPDAPCNVARRNGEKWGALNPSKQERRESRKGTGIVPGLKPKDLVGIPWRVAFALQADGWYLRQDIIWAKPNPMPESVRDRCTKAHEYVFLLTKRERYYWDAAAISEQSSGVSGGGWSVKTIAAQLNHGAVRLERPKDTGSRNRRSVWTVNTQPYAGAHFAVMPEKLVEPCVLAGSRHGDLVLDPFCGSGTVMRVAYRLGRRGVGCDLNPEYLDLAEERMAVTLGLPLEFPA